jgi:hypothetical protein
MSYDISLVDPVTRETLHIDGFPHLIRGGTHCVGGTTELWLNVTYNYAPHFYRVIPRTEGEKSGIRTIYGMTGAQSIPILQKAIDALSDDVDEDYWKATEGNAKHALCGLLAFAQLRPDGIWEGD